MNLKRRDLKSNNVKVVHEVNKYKALHKLFSLNNNIFNTSNIYFVFTITSAYVFSVLIGMYHHELWRDEIFGYSTIFYNDFLKYNGPKGCFDLNCIIYNSALFALVHLFPSYRIFQLFHLLIVALAVYIFNRHSPFSYVQKIFFTFSYFILFEYGIIARWYGFFILTLFILLYLLTRKEKNYILISIFLLVLASHTISTAIFAASLTIYILIHIINGSRTLLTSKIKRQLIISSFIFFTGIILVIFQYAYIYSNQGQLFNVYGHIPIFMTIRTIWSSYIPIPDFSIGGAFWNTNILPFPITYPQSYNVVDLITSTNIVAVVVSVLIILCCLLIYSKKLPVLLTYIFNTVVYFVFIHIFFRQHFVRHIGLLFIIFVYCSWLYRYSDEYIRLPFFNIPRLEIRFLNSKLVDTIFVLLVTIIFFLQFISGVLTYQKLFQYQFTKSWETAEYLRKNYDDYVLVGAFDYAVQPIAAILNKDIFFPQTNRFSKIVEYFGVNRNPKPDIRDILQKSSHIVTYNNKKVLIILNIEIRGPNGIPISSATLLNNMLLKKIKSFEGDIIQPDEQYYLYELFRKP